MRLPLYQVDAFTEKAFAGNPAAVMPLLDWLPDEVLQAIAEENHLSETAFFVPKDRGIFHLRWFTPNTEVDLCGHATLASAHVLSAELGFAGADLIFETRSGNLIVQRTGNGSYAMRFPARPPAAIATAPLLFQALGAEPEAVLVSDDYVAVYRSEEEIRRIQPNMIALCALDRRGVAITAPGTQHDFVARFFGPKVGVPEDPVTGSAYTALAPYWAKRLGKNQLRAAQVSARGGELHCLVSDANVTLIGSAITVLTGFMELSI